MPGVGELLDHVRAEWRARPRAVGRASYIGRRIAWTLRRIVNVPSVVEVSDGALMWLPASGSSTVYYLWRQSYEPEVQYLRSILSEGMTFVDVGAHFGLYTVVASRLVGTSGRVFAFEPNENNFRVLERNLLLNRIENVTAYQCALAARAGRAHLSIPASSAMGSIVNVDEPAGMVEVETRTLDQVLRDATHDDVDVVKLDVEGAEQDVLEGALATIERCRPVLIIEVNADFLPTPEATKLSVLTDVRRLGYRLFGVGDKPDTLERLDPQEVVDELARRGNAGGRSYRNVIAIHSGGH